MSHNEVDSNGILDQEMLALAIYCFRVQSETLRVQERWGFFSSGHPRLQVHEAVFFAFFAWTMLSTGFLQVLLFLLIAYADRADADLFQLFALFFWLDIGVVAIFWLCAVYGVRRKADYRWFDWNIRQE